VKAIQKNWDGRVRVKEGSLFRDAVKEEKKREKEDNDLNADPE